MNAIRTYFERFVVLSDEEWEAMAAAFERKKYAKGDLVLGEGDVCDFIAFIERGLFRFYHLKDGNEKVTAFWFEGDFLSNYRSFLSGQGSNHFIETMADGVVWKLRRYQLERLYEQYPNLDRLGRFMAEQLYVMVAGRLDSFLHDTPEERYRALLQKGSRLIQDIPQYMLASYLGVSAESLSRIRKRIAS